MREIFILQRLDEFFGKRGLFMKKEEVGIVLVMLLCATIPAVAAGNTHYVSSRVAPSEDGMWIHSGYEKTVDDWIHYDDRSCENSLGLTAGGTLYEVIKLTPEELGPYPGLGFDSIKVMHGCPDYPGCPETPYTAWIYYGSNHPSNPETEATIIANGTCPAMDGYFYINFSYGYPFNTTDTVWIGVGWTHPAGSYPCGFDTDSCIAGKSDWLWFPGGQWYELGGIGYPGNWNFEVHVSWVYPPPEPRTYCVIMGTYPVTVYLLNTMPEKIAYTVYELDNGPLTNYTGPFEVYEVGNHTILYYSVQLNGDHECPKIQDFTVTCPLTITIQGGVGITAMIKNIANISLNISGTIHATGLVIPKEKSFNRILPPGSEAAVKELLIGIGRTTITVTTLNATTTVYGTVMFIYVHLK